MTRSDLASVLRWARRAGWERLWTLDDGYTSEFRWANAERTVQVNAWSDLDGGAGVIVERSPAGRVHRGYGDKVAEVKVGSLAQLVDILADLDVVPASMHSRAVDRARLRELGGALNRFDAKYPNPFYVGFGASILRAIGAPEDYMGRPVTA